MGASRVIAPPARWVERLGRACGDEGLATAQALAVVWMVRAALGRVPFETLGAAVARLGRRRRRIEPIRGAAGARRIERIERVVRGVNRASRRVRGATCLTRALAVQALLGFTGVSSLVRYGVGRDANGGFRAHAWVECDGRVIIGGGEDMNGLVALSAQQC